MKEQTQQSNTFTFAEQFSIGQPAEDRFVSKMSRIGIPLIANNSTTLRGLQQCDFRDALWGYSWEVKSDQYANDRLCFEHEAVFHSSAQKWVEEFWQEYNFYSIDRSVIVDLIMEDQRRIKRGLKPKHYRQQAGQWHAWCTYVPIKEFLKLPTCQPV